MLSRSIPRAIPACTRTSTIQCRSIVHRVAHNRVATTSYQERAQRKQQQLLRSVLSIVVVGGIATLVQSQLLQVTEAEAPPQDENPLIFEKSRKKAGVTKEENRELISSQHHQVKKSWENPGVYAWGCNTGRVVAPDSNDATVRTPRRIAWFDGKLLRDIKLSRDFGAAIDEKGDLIQWGIGYSDESKQPTTTLVGKNLVNLAISRDRVLGLGKNGKVYSIPVSASDQERGTKVVESSWIPFMSSTSRISYRVLQPQSLKSGERITSVAGGLDHAILLTSTGRVFSAASATESFPNRGQLGVPGLTWLTRPDGSFDQPHEITTLKGFDVAKIACGDNHSLALDKDGRIFTWGDNSSGQLGFDNSPESAIVDAPSLVPLGKLYAGTSQVPTVTSIAAGGNNSYFTVDALKVASQLTGSDRLSPEEEAKLNRGLGRITADTFALGTGINGQLANNRWTHVQSSPTKIPSLSGLFEYDESANITVPIRLSHLSVGQTHAAAVMANITQTATGKKDSEDSTNWGADIVFWGGNEHYQLGTGKRNNVSVPVYLAPLDLAAEIARAKKSSGAREEHRFHITPRTTTVVGLGQDARKTSIEQRVECGRGVTCVYSGT
ncbi:RCC1/BLIP-II [Polychaeton citri CBS 116435]|uniref:RCC1/BLIP-II n=1 Tax=Polychaeton citri CBS 116435 TaxID=1314669 RepID=A0A9P4UJB2_9PEZI|nr:RCC1/BLIP-II [Polychaeton citri CBS 116435]